MAAQKLTRGRLIQIIVLMIILISAFIWRTVTYQPKISTQTQTQTSACSLNVGNCVFTANDKQITVRFLSKYAQANTPLELHVSNVDVIPSATISGITMNMGILPVKFTQQKDGWLGKFTVPECTHDNMVWAINIKINKDLYSSQFTVSK